MNATWADHLVTAGGRERRDRRQRAWFACDRADRGVIIEQRDWITRPTARAVEAQALCSALPWRPEAPRSCSPLP
jgi:hypothetical protein